MKQGLNIGSGQRPFHSTGEIRWINVDSQAKWNPDLVMDGAHLPEDFANSFDYVVLSHTLEHFGCGEAVGLVMESHRVLKAGGSLIVSVPDIRALAQRWLDGGLSTQIYVTNLYGAYMGSEDDRHKWGFDGHTLWNFLNVSAIWKNIIRFDNRSLPGMDLAADFWILSMEAVR